VEPGAVIEPFDESKDFCLCLGAGGELAAIDELEFERAPERFHGGIVVAIGFAAHGSQRPVLLQALAELGAGILAASIRMEQELSGRRAPEQGHLPTGQDQRSVEVRTHRPADDFAAIKIHHAGQVEPAFASGDVSDIGDPRLINPVRGTQGGQCVGGDRLVMPTVGRPDPITLFGPAREVLLAHQTGDAVAAINMAAPPQGLADARAAIGPATGLKLLLDQNRQLLVLAGARRRCAPSFQPGIVAAGRNGQHPAERANRILGFHQLDALEPLFGESERMPKVFFKISRCSRSLSFSRRSRESSCSNCWVVRRLSSGTVGAGAEAAGASWLFQV
jgi:hypothetical protein